MCASVYVSKEVDVDDDDDNIIYTNGRVYYITEIECGNVCF